MRESGPAAALTSYANLRIRYGGRYFRLSFTSALLFSVSFSLSARQAPAAAPVFRGSVSLGQALAGRSAPER